MKHHAFYTAIDLSPFTHLTSLKLRYQSNEPLDKYLTIINTILTNISSRHLKELCICRSFIELWPQEWHRRALDISLDSTLTKLAGLKGVDAILAQPQFSHLCHVQFVFDLFITLEVIPNLPIEEIPGIFSGFLPISADRMGTEPDPTSYEGLLDEDLREDAFRRYAENLIQTKIREEVKQLSARDILQIELYVVPIPANE